MKKSFFTIIIPLYNKENFVQKTIDSVFKQTFQDFEVLIIEDCSTDKSLAIAQLNENKRVKIIRHYKNKGLSASRNTGIINANSDFLVFLDADDLLKPMYLEKLFSLINNFPTAKLFATNYEEVFNKNKIINTIINLENADDCLINDFFEANIKQPLYSPSSLCVEKTVFYEIGFYNEKITYSEDVDFNIRANIKFKLAYSNEKLVQQIKTDVNQITNSSILGKIIPDFDSYEHLSTNKPFVKKYLDINRYMLASLFKKEGDLETYKKLKNGIDKNPKVSGLNYKQILLLELPSTLLKIIKIIKKKLNQNGYHFSSFTK